MKALFTSQYNVVGTATSHIRVAFPRFLSIPDKFRVRTSVGNAESNICAIVRDLGILTDPRNYVSEISRDT